jgi:hypothetical protein
MELHPYASHVHLLFSLDAGADNKKQGFIYLFFKLV